MLVDLCGSDDQGQKSSWTNDPVFQSQKMALRHSALVKLVVHLVLFRLGTPVQLSIHGPCIIFCDFPSNPHVPSCWSPIGEHRHGTDS